MHSQVPLPVRATQTIQLESAERRVLVRARVVRTTPSESGVSTAIEFIDLDAAAVEQIQQLLSPEADPE